MALRLFVCPVCGIEKETLKKVDPKCSWDHPESSMEEQIKAPNQKFMITANAATGTSKMKDSTKILKERARNHSRDVLGDDNIQINNDNGLKESVARNFLNSKGEKRRKIDDI